jgi:hypothetical protein
MAKLWVKFKSNPFRVSTDDCLDVNDFLKACKKELPSKLGSYSICQLSLSTTANGTSLCPGLLLSEIPGSSENSCSHPLFITAIDISPPSTQPTQAHLASFTPCRVLFYINLCNATMQDGCLVFQYLAPLTALGRIYVRESYQSIVADILDPAKVFQHPAPSISNQPPSIKRYTSKAIITGTPGIGKSLLLFYLLWRLVKDGKRVLIMYCHDVVYYDGNGGVFGFDFRGLPSTLDDSFWNADLWCLFDDRNKQLANLCALPYSKCSFVLSTYLNRDLVNDFKKPPVPQIFYMPPWTESELEVIAPYFPYADDWRGRFKILGGIPRHVLEVPKERPTQLIQSACIQCSLDECTRIIGLNSTIDNNAVQFLIHITSVAPFTRPRIVYASDAVSEVIAERKGEEAKSRMAEFLINANETL